MLRGGASCRTVRAHGWQIYRSFAGSRYRRLLWKPDFPSDLPPALRQNAAVIRHAAPEVSPHKKTWTIHASRRLHEVAPELCARGAVHELAANIVYHALAAIDCKCPRESARREREFRSDLFSTCSNLFEAHYSHLGGESVFGILNGSTLREISPTMKSNRRKRLREVVLDTIEEWVLLHRDSFSRVDGTLLLDIVGPRAFLNLIPRLGLNIRALRGEDIEVLFYHLTEETRDLFTCLRISLSLLPVESLFSPLGGSSWTLRRVLTLIEERRSEHGLRFLIAHLHPPSLIREVLKALRDRDFDTGLVRDQWSFMTSLELEADMRTNKSILGELPALWPGFAPPAPLLPALEPVDESREVPRGQRLWLTDGELMPFRIRRRVPMPLAGLAPPSRFRDTPWPQLAFDPTEALSAEAGETAGSGAADAYIALEGGAEEVGALALWTGAGAELSEQPGAASGASLIAGLPRPYAGLPLDAIHFVDSAQGLSHVITFLQQAPPAFVGIDLEWSDPHPVSIIQIATPTRAFVLDTVNRTPLYMSVLHCLLDWLMKREETTKLFFGFPHDLVRLNLLFGPHGRTFGHQDHIASIVDLYMQRVRRVMVRSPRPEDTPLGREDLLGEALLADDLDEVHRLSAELPSLPLTEELAERVYTVGGHHSLAGLALRYLGIQLNKSFRASNWNFRPLSAVQVLYAATDAHVLLRLEAALREDGALPSRTFGGARMHPALRPSWWREGRGRAEPGSP
mmetsp:Transcript_4957/g.14471  ORF Transcript_4957/g.14471 Transcript_4957/m.14471 type:complete len:742 (+) Transcript_4957:73-2298(+)